ncbi:MAG TPA: tetratricopeptide repeat protein [Candidatus Aquicultor sp.]
MKKKVIIAVIIIIAIAGLMYGRSRLMTYYSQQSGMAEAKGDYSTAIKNFDKVVLLESLVPFNANKPAAYAYRGRLYFNNGNTNDALTDFDTAIKLNKDQAESHFGIGLIRLQEGDNQQAIKEFEKVIKVRPKWTEVYLSREVAYRKLGEKEKAIKDLKKVLEIEPNNVPAKSALKALGQ